MSINAATINKVLKLVSTRDKSNNLTVSDFAKIVNYYFFFGVLPPNSLFEK